MRVTDQELVAAFNLWRDDITEDPHLYDYNDDDDSTYGDLALAALRTYVTRARSTNNGRH